MQSPILRPASLSDLPDILALLRDCKLLESGVSEALGEFIVASSGPHLVGCAGLETYGELGLLRSVAVKESSRKTGLGRRLVETLIDHGRNRALRELYLLTTTAPEFFTRLRFTPVERASVPDGITGSWEFQTGCPQTALPMRLPLG